MTRRATSQTAASDNRIFFGALLELLLIITGIGTAVVIYPILRRQNHVLALGYVTARIVENTFILVGVLAVLSIVTLGQQDAGGDEGAIAYTLAALKDWTFILGPGFIVGWGNGLILGYLMYASAARATTPDLARPRWRPAHHPLGNRRHVRRRPSA